MISELRSITKTLHPHHDMYPGKHADPSLFSRSVMEHNKHVGSTHACVTAGQKANNTPVQLLRASAYMECQRILSTFFP